MAAAAQKAHLAPPFIVLHTGPRLFPWLWILTPIACVAADARARMAVLDGTSGMAVAERNASAAGGLYSRIICAVFGAVQLLRGVLGGIEAGNF